MQMRRLCAFVVIAVLIPASAVLCSPVALARPAGPANPDCGSENYAQNGAYWGPSNGFVGGIRSPINLRTDGELCTSSNDFAADWIGIVEVGGPDIAQIGLTKLWLNGSRAYC
jgi:hypothetical protein